MPTRKPPDDSAPAPRKRAPKQTKDLLGKAVTENTESDPTLEQYKADLKFLQPDERRKRVQALYARNPQLTAATVADLFGVSIETINLDRIALKAQAAQRLANDPDLQADLFGPYEAMRDAALADAVAVGVDNPVRAAHRRTGLTAHEKLIDVMFRCGWIAEAPKKHELTGANGGPVEMNHSGKVSLGLILDDPEACRLATELEQRLSENAETPDGDRQAAGSADTGGPGEGTD